MKSESRAVAEASGNAAVIPLLLAELDALNVREYCVCAGARNAALLDALARRGPQVKLHRFFEERSAAFFALGRIMRTRQPVAVVTTSGTAVAELFPAVMEACYQALPLVLVTADRPSCYRDSGAPQAVEQPGIFGSYVVREVEIEGGALRSHAKGGAGRGGPLHFNVCLEEGLVRWEGDMSASSLPECKAEERRGLSCETQQRAWSEFWAGEGDLVVLATGIHPEDVPLARQFLLKLGAPVVAEATSNLCGDAVLQPLLLRGGERALRQSPAKRVLRLGTVPSWRWWRDLDSRADVRVLNVSRTPFRGLARQEHVSVVPWEMLECAAGEVHAGEKKGTAESTDATQEELSRLLDAYPNSEPAWLRRLSTIIGDQSTVMLGNSLPIREWNLAADTPKPGTQFFANRGANGIDGLISTWLGVGAEERASWLVIGDLSTLYDLAAPWILPQLPEAQRRIVIVNNGGGKIFSRVAWLKSAEPETQRLMENPHQTSFEPWARMWGMDYRLFNNATSLEDDEAACAVWELHPDAEQTESFWREWQG